MKNLLLCSILFITVFGLYTQAMTPDPYNEQLAVSLAYMSGAVYCLNEAFPINPKVLRESIQIAEQNTNELGYVFHSGIFSKIVQFGIFSSQVKVVIYKNDPWKQFVVAFEGTDNKGELLGELLDWDLIPFDLYPNDNIQVDHYFMRNYKAVFRTQLKGLLEAIKESDPTYTVIFTGHSLGGAFAALAALDSVWEGLVDGNNAIVYTFGQPRIGNVEFAKAFNEKIKTVYRIVHYRDPVPHIPLCHIGSNCAQKAGSNTYYYHYNTEVFYNSEEMKKGDYTLCNDEDAKCSQQFHLLQTDVNDHGWYFSIRINCEQSRINNGKFSFLAEKVLQLRNSP